MAELVRRRSVPGLEHLAHRYHTMSSLGHLVDLRLTFRISIAPWSGPSSMPYIGAYSY